VGLGGFLAAVVRRVGDPAQSGRYVGAAAILLFVGLSVAAAALVWLGADRETDRQDGRDGGEGEEPTAGAAGVPTNTPQDHPQPDDQIHDDTDHDTHDDTIDEKAEADATDH